MAEKMKCCGVEQEGPFCRYCGKKLAEPSVLRALLKHLERRLESALKGGKEGKPKDALIAKYEPWVIKVRELVKAEVEAESTPKATGGTVEVSEPA